jgi:Protein of unknown function (DUF1566)
MQSRWNRCLSGVGAAVLIGGLVLANNGGGIMPAEAHDHQREAYSHLNPFKQILAKLDEVLAKLSGGVSSSSPSSSSGVGAGNHTLRWDTNNPSASRFTTVFPGAVLDNNTGLVWEQLPVGTLRSWKDARIDCVDKNVGGTRGWRLPSVVELASLIDPSLGTPFVPLNVFTNILVGAYWSATVDATATNLVLLVDLDTKSGTTATSSKTSGSAYVWCVRAPMQESVY